MLLQITLERGLIRARLAFLAGSLLLGVAVRAVAGGGLREARLRAHDALVIPGVTLTALGFQTVLSSFFLSILGLHRR